MEEFNASVEDAKARMEKLSEIKREVQTALILENAPSEEDKDVFDVYIVDWLSENREKFAQAFEKLLSEKPEMLDTWEKDSESYIKKIKDLMK